VQRAEALKKNLKQKKKTLGRKPMETAFSTLISLKEAKSGNFTFIGHPNIKLRLKKDVLIALE